MDTSHTPFPPAHKVPLHQNAPLAPTQELAYRNKCIQLKKRLAEIELNNDATRRKIVQETQHVQKMRLLRSILLNHLKDIMETPAKKLTPEQRERLGVLANGRGNIAELAGAGITQDLLRSRPDGEGLLDDSSEESEEEEPEPQERPERRRRANHTLREHMATSNHAADSPAASYHQSALSNLAPASSFSSATRQDQPSLPSNYRVSSAAQANAQQHQRIGSDPYYGQSSPAPASHHHSIQIPSQNVNPGEEVNGVVVGHLSRPERPDPPFVQFTQHMQPQLEADNYPEAQIPNRIQIEWDNLSNDNRKLWEDRYQEQMREYTADLDDYKRALRSNASASAYASANS